MKWSGAAMPATAYVTGATSFGIVRFLLGAAEAGFFPGIILYLSQWFPAQQRAMAAAAVELRRHRFRQGVVGGAEVGELGLASIGRHDAGMQQWLARLPIGRRDATLAFDFDPVGGAFRLV